ncbi:phosphoglucosamine mutase [Bacteroidota bacterium]
MPTLMVSISGIRGIVGDGLDPETIVKYTSAFAEFCGKGKIVIGQDGRISGNMVKLIITGTLIAKGNDVIDLGICPTPTVLYNVTKHSAIGGIVISASHNPNEWNALKLINYKGEFMTPDENKRMMEIVEKGEKKYNKWDKQGKFTRFGYGLKDHINSVLSLEHIDPIAIRKRKFKVLLDCVNGAGTYILPDLLKELGCEVLELNCKRSGIFPRPPEPIPENLTDAMEAVYNSDADLGIVVDPDVDRLVLITDQGEPFGEEYTITQAVKFILSKVKGDVVINLSTTRAVEDVAKEFDCIVHRAPVGEANVVKKMQETNAVIGGEGSGGVIYPSLQYGRDAIVGTVITLQHLLEFGGTMTELKNSLPDYTIVKSKIELTGNEGDKILDKLKEKYKDEKINTEDGLRIDFKDHWVHFRKSNTEPVIRCIVEAMDNEAADEFIEKYLSDIAGLILDD